MIYLLAVALFTSLISKNNTNIDSLINALNVKYIYFLIIK